MLATLSPASIKRSIEIADWVEANHEHRPFWMHPEYFARFAGSSDAELRAAAIIVGARNAEREREIAGLELIKAAMKVARLAAES
jgi:hypothetical protein